MRDDAGPLPTLLPTVSFEDVFRSSSPARDKFLSRLFGIFSEDIVRIWARNERAPYEDLGRPTVKVSGQSRGKTLDFTLRSRKDGRVYIAELKCELEYENYRYLTLSNCAQLNHHKQDAFTTFLSVARDPTAHLVSVGARPIKVSGAILVWGSVTSEGRKSVCDVTGLSEVLSLEECINDLWFWHDPALTKHLTDRADWCSSMLTSLAGPGGDR